MADQLTLDEISPGNECVMTGLTAEGALGQRLMDLGFFPGARVQVVRNAPLVDPIEIELDGYHVTLRHEEARTVEVSQS
ncbi:MAG: ferrous iron transport protein A [Halodesulfovibrio sp.]|uniref:FeoA family protein n=1 Tax=Halodesulfovibrio sp. TaxID=1912772 RepID=UPI00359EAB87